MIPKPATAGFALIIVLWTIVLLSLLVTHIEQAGQNEAKLALNLRRAAAQQAEADGAVALAAFHLIQGAAQGWAADGQPHVIQVRDDAFTDHVTIDIADEAGKIDLNTAPEPLLQALLTIAGTDQAAAGAIAARIIAWRFPTGPGPAAVAVAAPYRAAGLDYGPPGAQFQSLDELDLVLGMTPGLLASLDPHLTLYQQSGMDPARADPVVRQVLAMAAGFQSAAAGRSASDLQDVTITATAYGSGSAFTRRAIVQVGPQKDGWMRILTWTRSSP